MVDDEPGVRDLLFQVLSRAGYGVHLAPDGPQALDLIRINGYDCIIMDLKMPGMTGQELYQLLRGIDPSLEKKVIFATGDTVRPEAKEFLDAMGNPALAKPINLEELLRQVQHLLATDK